MSIALTISEGLAVQAVIELLEDRGIDAGEIDGATALAELGLDSIQLAELFMLFEEALGTRLDPASAEGILVVADLTRLRPFEQLHV